MSAIIHWMPCISEMVLPNAFLCLAYSTASSYAACATPTAWAAMPIRLAFRTSIVALNPSYSSPIRLVTGTRQSSKNTSHVDEARIPILPCMGLIVMPGVSPSTIRATKPRDPRLRSSDASTIITPASVAFVMKTFAPFRT